MSTGFINSGVTGIQVAQLGLQTTSHNITNANTPGFNRQRTVQASNLALPTGSGFVGQGVNVSTVDRMYSEFLNGQVIAAQTTVSELDSYYAQVSQIDNILADPNAGLSPALQDFFTGVQQVAANPSQLPARQAMVSSAQVLVSRFQGLDERISGMYDSVNGQLTSTVSSINSYASQIGVLNEQIVIAQSAVNQPANDLFDQRDQLVSELNKLIKVSTSTNNDGSYNVFVGTGQQLVVGVHVSAMSAQPSTADSTRFAVGLVTPGGNQELPELLVNGGSLGGLLRFRSESLDRVANDVGRNAASLALTFNAQHQLGQDLLGNASVDGSPPFQSKFFTVSEPTVLANANNSQVPPAADITSTLSVPTSAANYTYLTNADYQLAFDGTNYTLTRSTDNHNWSSATIPFNVATMVDSAGSFFSASEGITLTEAAPMRSGDSFKIEPARAAARNLAINAAIAADPRLIAAAAPIRSVAGTISGTGAIINSNSGSALITAGSVSTAYAAPAAGSPITLVYSGGQFTGFPAGTVSVTSGVTTTNYTYPLPAASIPYTNGATISFSGFSFEISGVPNNGDKFSIARNGVGVSDGRNALAFGQLQTQKTMSGNSATYQSAYAQLVSDVGNITREIKVTGAAQQALLDQSSATRDSLSGVNLDEEAANLIRFQQAYQASAKVIDMGSKLFDVLLAIRS